MESGLIAVIALLVLLGSAVALLARQGMIPFSLPAIRTLGAGVAGHRSESAVLRAAAPEAAAEAPQIGSHSTAAIAAGGALARANQAMPALPDTALLEVFSQPSETVAARLERIEEHLDEVQRAIVLQGEDLRAEVRRIASESASRAEIEDARREGAVERLRGDLLTVLSGTAADGKSGANSRRADACAELYARLARLEAALAAVTNPILLPGEAYAPPGDFPPEALVWENWNEVGERAFALADAFSAQRLLLAGQTRIELGRFVTTLRTILTRSVYPNLQPDAGAAQHAALRAALEQIAREIPRARDTLERAYWDGEAS